MSTRNSARPSAFVSLDDPLLDTLQDENEMFPFRNHPRARQLAHLGLMDKAHSALRCGLVCSYSCESHGERHKESRSCNQRFCPRCGARIVQDRMDRHCDKFELAASLKLKFVLCRVTFEAPFGLDHPDIRAWTTEAFDFFQYNWDRYMEADVLPAALLHAISCVGFENVDGTEHLVCYALMAAEDVDYMSAFAKVWEEWGDTCQVTVSKSYDPATHDSGDGYFRRMATIPAMDGERSAYHESIFPKGMHLLRVSQFPTDIFTEDGKTVVNMCTGEIPELEPDTADERDETPPQPKSPRCCDICGKVCLVTFKDPYGSG
jgi:hypothetical protein